MRRPLRPEEARLWAVVARSVRRAPGVAAPSADPFSQPAPAPHDQPVPTDRAPARPSLAPPGPSRPLATAQALSALAAAGVGRHPPNASRGAISAIPAASAGPGPIEPNRRRRIVRAREPIGARLDLHGYDQDRARAALHAFIVSAQSEGARAVLVITGKGRGGEGVLRTRLPEWLAEPPARAAVAGVSRAEARHGGEGALYIALKRRD